MCNFGFMSTIMCLLVMGFSPFTWFSMFKNKVWVTYTMIGLNFLCMLTHFIEGKWLFGIIWLLATIMWSSILVLQKRRKEAWAEYETLRTELETRRQELLDALRESRDNLRQETERLEIERQLRELKPRRSISESYPAPGFNNEYQMMFYLLKQFTPETSHGIPTKHVELQNVTPKTITEVLTREIE